MKPKTHTTLKSAMLSRLFLIVWLTFCGAFGFVVVHGYFYFFPL